MFLLGYLQKLADHLTVKCVTLLVSPHFNKCTYSFCILLSLSDSKRSHWLEAFQFLDDKAAAHKPNVAAVNYIWLLIVEGVKQ